MGKLRLLSKNGDDLTEWEAENEASTAVAKKVFDEQLAIGARAFTKTGKGEHELIHSFDPAADEILITRPLVGG